MVQINFGQREVSCKVVFYGPGMSGKTTNLEIIHKKAPKDAVGEMVSIATETDRTLYFDFLPLDLGQVAGMRTKFQLYTVPGQIYYNATRKLVLQGVDGVIFVADSNPEKMAENLESLQNLRDNLAEMNLTLDELPLVLQYNKRDLPNALSVADMNAQMNPMGVPTFEACARDGKGVFATLKEISRLVIEKLNKEHAPAATRRRTNNTQPSSGAAPAPAPAPLSAAPRPAAGGAPAPRPAAAQAGGAGSGSRATVSPANVAQSTPVRGNPAVPSGAVAANARDRHLAKGKPPALDNRSAAARQEPVPTPTDPNLKRYQEDAAQAGNASGPLKMLLTILVVVVICVLLLVVAVLFVPSVRALLPQSMQQRLFGGDAPVEQPATAPATGGAHGQ